MNKTNLFLQIFAITLLGVSSISFAMDNVNLEKEKNKQKLHKFFKLGREEELAKDGFEKLSDDEKFALLREKDGTEKFFIFIDEGMNQGFKEVSSFKFNKDESQIFLHVGEKAILVNLKTNERFDIDEALPVDDYEYYGFTTKDKNVFIITNSRKSVKIFKAKNGEFGNYVSLLKSEVQNPKAIQKALKLYTTNYTINDLMTFGRDIINSVEREMQDAKDVLRFSSGMTTAEEEEHLQDL